MKKIFLISLILIFFNFNFFSEVLQNSTKQINHNIELLNLFEVSYPQVKFKKSFDKKVNDWKIEISVNEK